MIIDEIDIKILEILYSLSLKEKISLPYGLLKRIYPNLSDYEKKKRYTNLLRKLKKLADYGVIKIIKESDKIDYQLQSEKVNFKKLKFKKDFKKTVCIKVKEIGWCAFEVNGCHF